ncbi:hypothetical protein LINPERPRIM_LOCUS35740 [Linum perenne]
MADYANDGAPVRFAEVDLRYAKEQSELSLLFDIFWDEPHFRVFIRRSVHVRIWFSIKMYVIPGCVSRLIEMRRKDKVHNFNVHPLNVRKLAGVRWLLNSCLLFKGNGLDVINWEEWAEGVAWLLVEIPGSETVHNLESDQQMTRPATTSTMSHATRPHQTITSMAEYSLCFKAKFFLSVVGSVRVSSAPITSLRSVVAALGRQTSPSDLAHVTPQTSLAGGSDLTSVMKPTSSFGSAKRKFLLDFEGEVGVESQFPSGSTSQHSISKVS